MEIAHVILNIVITTMFTGISFLFKNSYPKDINSMIGYRTKRSMSSQTNWIEANKYASNLLFKLSMLLVLIQIGLFILLGGQVAFLGTLALWVVMLFLTIFITERRLKNIEPTKNIIKEKKR